MSQTTDQANAAADTKTAEPEFGEALEEELAALTALLDRTRANYKSLVDIESRVTKARTALEETGKELKEAIPRLRAAIDLEAAAQVAEADEEDDPEVVALVDILGEFLACVTSGIKGIDLRGHHTTQDASLALRRLEDAYDKYEHGVTNPSAGAIAQFTNSGGH
jgi:small-conductance mechanosensitive channel